MASEILTASQLAEAMEDERLADLLEELTEDPQCRAVVLCSAGKHFCAGADFSGRAAGQGVGDSPGRVYQQAVRLFASDVPMVAAVQGSAVGGGLGLVGDIVVGIVGAFVGGYLFRRLHIATPFHGVVSKIFVAFVGAVLLLLILRLFRRGSSRGS